MQDVGCGNTFASSMLVQFPNECPQRTLKLLWLMLNRTSSSNKIFLENPLLYIELKIRNSISISIFTKYQYTDNYT